MAAGSKHADVSPPVFLQLAGNPVRWRLLTELARSDLRVGELVAAIDQPQNTVSYHLGRLRAAGLVSMRRSSADHRDSYYHADLNRCGELLASTGAALHPGLSTAVQPALTVRRTRIRNRNARKVRVLFLCTGNSARSQMAEALLARAAGEYAEVASAGSHPKELHPNAVRAMRAYDIDLTGRRSKHLDEFAGRRFHHVITLCDKLREICPEFTGSPETAHWSIADPAAEGGYAAFRRVAADLHTRIVFLTHYLGIPTTTATPTTPTTPTTRE
ncbi:ArsR family transcriptional regulator [Actinopolymorpha singaporensis]|uniref:Protein-tyrosine-phosphatase n=1 Tax=Actinopolymorpha singaporensis TaxID=117157 RepID=A0A1H1M3S6_9ACTN|nr:ArsR family transcriptional regulator [Actinopolymorpha singaporensis]SDR81453.1 Protein-tyrosine-phosphatase [Actinopolymorpha singaporensis]